MKTRTLVTSLLLLATISGLGADSPHASPATSDSTVILRYGKEVTLSGDASQSCVEKTVELIGTSNFNSTTAEWKRMEGWSIGEIQNEYRKTISGKYLLVSFKQPRRIKTVGGNVTVLEVVVGLNQPDIAGPLFTIDDEGKVVAHSKYSGELCVKLSESVKRIVWFFIHNHD